MKKYLFSFALASILSLLVFYGQGLFAAKTTAEALRIVSDGCFLSAVLFIGLGLLGWMANLGQFTSLKYVGHLLRSTFSWGYPRRKIMSYHDFKQEVEGKESKREFAFLIITGTVFFTLALIANILFNKLA